MLSYSSILGYIFFPNPKFKYENQQGITLFQMKPENS